MKFTFRGFSEEMPTLRLTFSEPEEPLLSVLVHFFEHGRWGSLVETAVEGQSLTAEDQLFILMQAGLYLTATRGLAAPEARICYERAEPLCHSLNRPRLLYVALMGQWRYSLMTDKLSAAMQIAERVYSLAQEQNDAALMISSLQRFGSHTLLFGRFRVRATIRDAWCSDLALGKRPVSCGRGHTPVVSCLCYEAMSEWHLGEIASCHAMMDGSDLTSKGAE